MVLKKVFLFLSARHTNKLKAGTSPWPPFRQPSECGEAYEDPRKILRSKVFHAVALVVLQKAVRGLVSEHVMALIVFLLEQAVLIAERDEQVCKTFFIGLRAKIPKTKLVILLYSGSFGFSLVSFDTKCTIIFNYF